MSLFEKIAKIKSAKMDQELLMNEVDDFVSHLDNTKWSPELMQFVPDEKLIAKELKKYPKPEVRTDKERMIGQAQGGAILGSLLGFPLSRMTESNLPYGSARARKKLAKYKWTNIDTIKRSGKLVKRDKESLNKILNTPMHAITPNDHKGKPLSINDAIKKLRKRNIKNTAISALIGAGLLGLEANMQSGKNRHKKFYEENMDFYNRTRTAAGRKKLAKDYVKHRINIMKEFEMG